MKVKTRFRGFASYFWILLAGLAITFWWLFPLVVSCILIGWLLRESADPYVKLWKDISKAS